VALLIAAAAAVVGGFSFKSLRQDVFPIYRRPSSTSSSNPSMGSEELETAIAVPMEVALAGLPR